MLKRILNPPSKIFFFSDRWVQVEAHGCRHSLPAPQVIDLLSEITYQGLLANPGLFASQLRTVPPGKRVFIDEVQRLPAMKNDGMFFDYFAGLLAESRLCP